jgi:hypothetical protein
MIRLACLLASLLSASALANPSEWMTCSNAKVAVDLATNSAGRPETVGILASVRPKSGASSGYSTTMDAKIFDRQLANRVVYVRFGSGNERVGGTAGEGNGDLLLNLRMKAARFITSDGVELVLKCKPVNP